MSVLGSSIKRLRGNKGLTQSQLSAKIGVAECTISLYESGGREPDIATLIRIADFFNVGVDELLGRNNIPVPTAKTIPKTDDALANDPELLEFWLETKKRPDLQIFLKQVRNASPRVIRQMMKIIKVIEDGEASE